MGTGFKFQMGMGMKSLKWEGIGTKNVFPHTSNLNYIHASESTLDNGTSGTASHSVDTTYWQLFRPDINTAYFYFFCCRSYVKLLDY